MDEFSPLLRVISDVREPTVKDARVDFDPNGDPDNPMDWSKLYKLAIVSLLALMSFTVTFTCIGIVPVADRIVFDLKGKEDRSASILLVTVWELGEACGPLLIAPLSEIYGRYPTFNVANCMFILGVILAATSPSAELFIFARFLTGCATASNVLNPAVIGDIYPSEARGLGMSLVMLSPLIGGAVGPAISGVVAQTLGWRVILWMSAAIAIFCQTLFFFFLKETYKIPILQKRAARLREETHDDTLECPWETKKAASDLWWSTLRTSIQRPILMMFDSSVLQILCFYEAIVFTFYYVMATTLPEMLAKIYGFNPAQIGYSFLTFSIGASGGILITSLYLDRIYIALGKSHGGVSRPEYRLPFLIIGAVLIPFAVAIYGWAPYAHWPVYILLLSVAIIGTFLLLCSVSPAAYIVDAFGLYSASAMTVLLVTRCLTGTVLPLVIPPLTDALGLGYGFIIVAGVCLVLVPLPIAVMRYGSHWRQNSVYTRDE